MSLDSDVNVNKTEQQQQARAKLREGFLKGISNLTGTPCTITTYEQNSLSANLAGWDPHGSEVLFRDFVTPNLTTTKAVLLRATDILAIQFNHNDLSQFDF